MVMSAHDYFMTALELLPLTSSRPDVIFHFENDHSLRDIVLNSRQEWNLQNPGLGRMLVEDRDIILQLFSPLVASFMSMREQLHLTYHAVELQPRPTRPAGSAPASHKQQVLVMRLFSGHRLVLGCYNSKKTLHCSGSSLEIELWLEELGKVAWVFQHLFGPNWDLVSRGEVALRKSKHRLVRALLHRILVHSPSPCSLYFHAIEHVTLSPEMHTTVQTSLKSLVEQSFSSSKTPCPVDHVLLLSHPHCKLLSQVSSQSPYCRLSADSILFIANLAQVLCYPQSHHRQSLSSIDADVPDEEDDRSCTASHSADSGAGESLFEFTSRHSLRAVPNCVADYGPFVHDLSSNSTDHFASYRLLRVLLQSTFNVLMPFYIHFLHLAREQELVLAVIQQVEQAPRAVTLISHLEYLRQKSLVTTDLELSSFDLPALVKRLHASFGLEAPGSRSLKCSLRQWTCSSQSEDEEWREIMNPFILHTLQELANLAKNWRSLKGAKLDTSSLSTWAVVTSITQHLENLLNTQYFHPLAQEQACPTELSKRLISTALPLWYQSLQDYLAFLEIKAQLVDHSVFPSLNLSGVLSILWVNCDTEQMQVFGVGSDGVASLMDRLSWCRHWGLRLGAQEVTLVTTERFRITFRIVRRNTPHIVVALHLAGVPSSVVSYQLEKLATQFIG